MRALVKYAKGPGMIEMREIPVPEPGPGEAIVRVKAAAVCASDVYILHDCFTYEPPLVLGHEFSGVVERLGPGVSEVCPDDRVVSENNPAACGICRICEKGYPNLCPAKQAIGFKSDGCFAEVVKIPAHLLHRVPDGVSFRAAALSEPLAVAVHAVEDRCGIESGDTVVVLGPGAIGLLAAQVARAEGAGRVIVSGTERDAERLACAQRLGFETRNVEKAGGAAQVQVLTDPIGADVVVECAGAGPAIDLGLRLLRRAGRMVVVGITGKQSIPVAWDTLLTKGASVFFSYSSRKRNWNKGMDYLSSKRVDTESLITRILPLAQWGEAFEQMERQEGIRFILEP
jgi:L-iditol 2-dehydrogenase